MILVRRIKYGLTTVSKEGAICGAIEPKLEQHS
jgi:hypothetical protein